jgi:hypothetical protein
LNKTIPAELPRQFSELTPFAGKWDLSDTNSRYAARLGTAYADLVQFHGALKKHLPDIRSYLDAKGMDRLDESDRRLARLAFAWVPVAQAVEIFKQQRVPDSKMTWDVQVEPEL